MECDRFYEFIFIGPRVMLETAWLSVFEKETASSKDMPYGYTLL